MKKKKTSLQNSAYGMKNLLKQNFHFKKDKFKQYNKILTMSLSCEAKHIFLFYFVHFQSLF